MKYKVGDRVKVIGNSNNHGIEIGKEATIEIIKDGYFIDAHVGWAIRFKDVKPIKQVDKIETTKPKHYQTNSFDVIDLCNEYKLNFNRGNVVKYVCRAGKKNNEIEDLLKAKDYICRELEFLTKDGDQTQK